MQRNGESDVQLSHRKTAMAAGRGAMQNEANAILNQIQKVKAARIATWASNAEIEDPKPVKDALSVAIGVVGNGMGGVVAGILTSRVAKGMLQEFLQEASVSGTSVGFEAAVKAAIGGADDVLTKGARDAVAAKAAQSAGSALTSKGDLLSCFLEAQTLFTLEEEASQVTRFNFTVGPGLSDEAMADHVFALRKTHQELMKRPDAFMRELSVGMVRLQDEVAMHSKAGDYGGDRDKMLREDPSIDETEERKGNILVLPAAYPGSLGKYYQPSYDKVPSFRALATGLNNAALASLTGAPVMDLPIAIGFRFWASNPFSGLFEEVFCKVWFTRRADGSIIVDTDESGDDEQENGLEWLSSLALGTSRELSRSERRKHCADGARIVYEAVKDRVLVKANNSDIL